MLKLEGPGTPGVKGGGGATDAGGGGATGGRDGGGAGTAEEGPAGPGPGPPGPGHQPPESATGGLNSNKARSPATILNPASLCIFLLLLRRFRLRWGDRYRLWAKGTPGFPCLKGLRT